MNMRIAFINLTALLLLFLLASPLSAAEYTMYKWVDSNGIVHIEDEPPKDKAKSTKVEKISSEEGATSRILQSVQAAGSPGAKQASPPAATVEIYVTSWCSYCRRAKEYLHSRGIAYQEYDIEKDQAALQRKRELSPQGGVPVAVINGQVVTGFSSETYDRVLAGGR